MKLFDTTKRRYVTFAPPKQVALYTCGITPYDSAHLGHIFTFMTYDLLQRRLEDQGHEVRLVRNITDVDDPIFIRAAEIGIPYTELAEKETTAFQAILKRLNFRPAYAEPRASDYIEDMAVAVKTLLDKGYAYHLEDDIYFDTKKLETFGSFSHLSHRLELAFMRSRGGDPDRPGKRRPLDFLLWHGVSDPADSAVWESVVGRGRPGWHIECSVMASKILGTPFDLHGGGSDLIFPHHECEIAQSCGLGDTQLARTWMHVAPLSYLGEKMSKSLGNLVFAKDLLSNYEPATIRLALMYYHYRTGGEWLPQLLDEAVRLLDMIRKVSLRASKQTAEALLNEVRRALDDDLDTHAIRHALQNFAEKACRETAPGDGGEALAATLNLLGL